jgi:uncharacterized protein
MRSNEQLSLQANIFVYNASPAYSRPVLKVLKERLEETPRRMVVVAGPRQIGKSTLVKQALNGRSATFISADQPISAYVDPFALGFEGAATTTVSTLATNGMGRSRQGGVLPDAQWLIEQWQAARDVARRLPEGQHHVLAIDEIQIIPRWSDLVKGLWDSDRTEGLALQVVLLDSSPWLIQKGRTESLAGRYEPIYLSHWSYPEMRDAFGVTLDQYLYFGGYPEPASLLNNEERWHCYVRDTLVLSNIDQDILLMTRVEKPAVLKRLFELGCGFYSGQILALQKMMQVIQDAGNTATLSHYLNLLSKASLLTGLQKFAGQEVRRRASPPKFNAYNTALISSQARSTFGATRLDPERWGHLVESAVGAHLLNELPINCTLHYWREGPHEVDFVLGAGRRLVAIEVKSTASFTKPKGLEVFKEKFKQRYDIRTLLIGPELETVINGNQASASLEDFLCRPIEDWLS